QDRGSREALAPEGELHTGRHAFAADAHRHRRSAPAASGKDVRARWLPRRHRLPPRRRREEGDGENEKAVWQAHRPLRVLGNETWGFGRLGHSRLSVDPIWTTSGQLGTVPCFVNQVAPERRELTEQLPYAIRLCSPVLPPEPANRLVSRILPNRSEGKQME